ncbi:hypothetical protein ACU8KH_00788 [Lachancea thermotolerans]
MCDESGSINYILSRSLSSSLGPLSDVDVMANNHMISSYNGSDFLINIPYSRSAKSRTLYFLSKRLKRNSKYGKDYRAGS